MGCVNRNGKEFKALAARNNVAANTLELFTHKYWLETGNETLFPSDVYIQAQLGNSHYLEKGEHVRALWRKQYSSPKEFTSMGALQSAYKEASKYFPESAIVYYKNAKGNFMLSVKRPVEKATYTKDDFFDEFDNMGSMKDVKKFDLGIKENQTYGIDKVQELYNRFNTDKTSQALADRAFNIAKELGLQITFDESLPFGTTGRYTNDNTIRFKKSFLERDMMNSKKAPIMLHEVLHALSMYALSNQTKNWKRSENLEKFRTEMNELYNELKDNPILKDERGAVDLHEFVAELGNPVFREKIQNIDREIAAGKKLEKKSFWQRILDAFKSLLGLHVTNTYYQRSMNALEKAFDAFDIDTYMRYNGTKNLLRQGYNAKEWEFNSMSDAEVKSTVTNYFDKEAYNQELQSIKEKAIANGTFMKAPNGKPTNLNEKQWLQVRTKNFKEWFGDWENNPSEASKVVDKNGEPEIVYHGTRTPGIKIFDLAKTKSGAAFWFANEAGQKMVFYAGQTQSDLILMPLFVNMRQPLLNHEDSMEHYATDENHDGGLLLGTLEEFKSFGLDESEYQEAKELGLTDNSYFAIGNVTKSEQLKSATDNTGEFSTVNPEINNYEIGNSSNENTFRTELKPEYKGKLIYAQSGTGKSSIADNVTVFDSDYILGEILGVSPQTAGFFFGNLSIKQKKAFSQQYRDAIKQKVAEGYTVVTSNKSLLNDADVVVYNSSAEQTEERVNRADRALTNKYHALNYHRDTLTEIKELKDNDKENSKEYIELDKDHYLSDFISSRPSVLRNPSTNLYDNTKQEAPDALLEVSREKLITDFLNEFGISVHTISEYDGELPLFDALNRVINARNASEITDGVGYAIAFMMQGDSDVQRMIVSSHFGLRGNYGRKVPFTNTRISNLHPTEHSPIAREVLREIGKRISEELRNNFGTDIEEVKSRKTIWKVIKNFFKKLGMTIVNPLRRGSVIKREKILVRSVIDALGREDFSRIKGPRVKEDTTELAQRVGVEEALKENPYEDNIIRKLGEHGIALAGSTSIALQGSLFRPSENPLHDIDFDAGANSSKATIDKVLSKIFDKDTVQYSHSIHKKGKDSGTETYITLSVPFTLKKTGFDTAEFYGKDGKYLGRRKKSDLFLEDGIQGKMLDFFVGNTLGSKHGFYNRTINGHNYLISDSNAAIAAKILWARPKDMWDYKYFKRDSFQEVPADFIKSMSGKQLKDELSVIKQESADYDLINGVEEEQKHSGKAEPTVFTFADGTKVQAPFRPNAQQVDALNAMDRFMKSQETSMTLSGYAGTGKTSLMEILATKAKMQYRPIVFCASTNKAAAVLKNRVFKAGFDASTLNKIFGIQVEVDPNSKSYNVKNLVNKVKDDIEILPGTTVIIDEASMINEENYTILNRIAKQKGLKIIYTGDAAQLAPVNENQISKVFRNGDGKVVTLTQVERTDDNAILKEATDIRNGKPLSRESSFNSKGEGVAYISPEHQGAIDEVIEHYVKGLKKDPNYFRILAYTNKAVANYNNQVRELLGYNTPVPQKGEPMTGYTNWGYDWRSKSYRFINSEAYKVIGTSSPITVSARLADNIRVSLEAIPVTLEDSMGKIDTFNYIDIKGNPQNRQAATVIANEKKRLHAKAKQVVGKTAKAEIYARINELDSFLFVNDSIEDSRGNTLQFKTIDFGYAMTVHKSQGSTFTHVLMDDVDISRGSRSKDMSNAWSVDLGEEVTNDASTAQLNSTLDVDLGDLSAAEDTSINGNTTNSNTINQRQQLEYVGVSRATDTVTIISNGVKKEGSPLHPEGSIKEDRKSQPRVEKTLAEKKLEEFKKEGIFFSGAADGADQAWARELEALGLKVKNYVVSDYDNLSDHAKESVERSYKDIVRNLGRKELPANSYSGKLVRRDLLQVDGARAVYAIGTFDSNGHVSGGTAYAIEYARMIGGKPVYFYDLNTHKWYYAIDSKAFSPMVSLPYLEKQSAVIGTRDDKTKKGPDALRPEGIQAIKDVIANTFGNAVPQNSISEQLISHLKSQGINVKDRAAMEEYLNTHNLEYLQQALDLEGPQLIHKDNTESQGVITNNPISQLRAKVATTKQKYDKVIKELNEVENKLFHDTIYSKSLHTEDGDIKVFQNSSDKHLIGIDSGNSIFNKVSTTLVLNTKEGKIGGSLLFPSRKSLDKNNNYLRIDNPIRRHHASLLKSVLDYYIQKGVNKPTTEWTLWVKDKGRKYGLENLIDKIDTLGKILGIDVSKYITLELDFREAITPEGNPSKAAVERAEIDARGLRDAIPSVFINEELITSLSKIEDNKTDYSLMHSGLKRNYKELQSQCDNLRKQLQSVKKDLRNKLEEESDLPFFMTPQGEVYGFVDKEGNIYLDETKISPEHPIHEYTHLWDRTVQQKNPKLWQRGVELMKQTSLWNEILNDANYGKQWQSMNLSQEKMDNLIASEVHARFTGEGGEKLLNQLAEEKGQSGIIAKLKQWILDMWKDLKATFGNWSQDDLDSLTLKDFNHMTVRDFTEGTNLKDASNATYASQQLEHNDIINNNNQRLDNKDNNEKECYKPTDEFKRVQEAIRGSSKEKSSGHSVFTGYLTPDQRQHLADVLGRQLGSINSFIHGSSRNVSNTKHGTTFKIHYKVNPQLFHDVFEVVRYYTKNAELVDLHDDYSNCECYLTEDGTAGFAVEPDGNLVSVFNLGTTKGFLSAIKDLVREAGATHLDAYASSKQNLELMYAKTLGFHTASTMDYNMEYDHDDIAKNHDNPQVVFMVDHEVAEPKHFDKDSYDAAQQYQLAQLKQKQQVESTPKREWSRYSQNGYEVSTKGDSRFSALKATFKPGTVLFGHDVSGRTIESVYQHGVKQGDWTTDNNSKTGVPKSKEIIKGNDSEASYAEGYLPLWKEWARQNPELMAELREKSQGKVLTDMFVNPNITTVSQARALAEILDESEVKDNIQETSGEKPSFAEGETQKVSLPGYEYFNELYEDTTVDAEWKVSYLKELDAQLSMDNSLEESNDIINQMDKVLQATSEEEYKQELNNTRENEIKKTLDDYDKINRQLNNLLDNDEGLTATDLRHVAQQIADEISDLITQLQNEKGLAAIQYPSVKTNIDFMTASRKEIVQAIGIDNLIRRAQKVFEVTERDDIDTDLQADLILENWDALMSIASDSFAFNEGFGIRREYSKGHYTTTDSSTVDYDNYSDYSNDPDVNAEEGGKDEQEHWQIENRTIDVLNSMSALVRQGLHECYILDADGNKVISKWGIAERVNPRNATNSILRWTQGSLSMDDMISKLSEKQKQNPWLSTLITRLSDKTGQETDFQSQFYGVFQKHFQPYSIVLLEDGKYHSIPVNNHPALTEAMDSISAQFKIGEHSLFTSHRINARDLGSKNTTGEKAESNLYKSLFEMQEIKKTLKTGGELTSEMADKFISNVLAVCRILNYNVSEDMISDITNEANINQMTSALGFIVQDLTKAKDALASGKIKEYDPFKYYGDYNIRRGISDFLGPVTEKLEDVAISAFYDSGKMYQSYVTPSFMTKLMNKFRQSSREDFEAFIMNEYGSSEWFKDRKKYQYEEGWRNEWLQKLATDENIRQMFDHKVELNFNKHNYMRTMSDSEYALSLITEYYSENADLNIDMAPSWYRVPMQSNKPSSEFIKCYSYRGDKETYKKNITNGLQMIFNQELSRIQTVRMRNLSKNDPGFIKNFDTNGRKFCFLPVLNSYLENTATAKQKRHYLSTEAEDNRLAELLQDKVEGKEIDEGELNKLVHEAIRNSVEERVQDILNKWEKDGILEAAQNIKGIYPKDYDTFKTKEEKDSYIKPYVRDAVENYLWNDTFAAKNILQLTLTDIAFYKDAEDLQKRLAQLHAPGIRGRVDATDYGTFDDKGNRISEGKRVSDGKYRTLVLKDYDNFKSNIIANITEVFDKKIHNAKNEAQKKQLEALKDSLVRKPGTLGKNDKGGKYWNINVADAQGFSSPASYRKKALIFGKWSKHAEEIYQKLQNNDYNYTDLQTAFQPLKPFVYSKLEKNMGVEGAPITKMPVPFQAKNAEYLLIMADALLKGEETSRPNLLRAIYRVMEDSEKLCPTKGIDTVQFESAIKSSLQGAMDIAQFREMEGGEEAAYTFMKDQIFKEEYNQDGKRVYQNYNTDTFVHETSYEDYCLQQEVPEHFKNHSQAHGSQIRMITPSDLDAFTTDENGNQIENFYEWTEPDPNNPGKQIHRKVTANEYRREYEQTLADNVNESINTLAEELGLAGENRSRKEQNIALAKILQREILSSPRYGIDLIQACSIDKETGEFRIPKGDPIQAKRIEQLINSIIKNRINKQKIAGGPIVQVSNFGTSQQLHIRFKDKNTNGILPLEEEYNPAEHNNMSYKDYCAKYQGGIAHFEVFMPIWSNELFEKFGKPDGTIDVEAIEAMDPELLKMVSYRIPTEDKYSCAPMKVVGFMPREAGDAIMLPYELTEIDDSDFDVDKRYVMRKDISIKTKKRSEIEKELFDRACKSYEAAHEGQTNKRWIGEQIKMFLNNPQKMRTADAFMQSLYKEYQAIAYYTEAPTEGRTFRDNKIVDMTYAVLSNEMTADKILNPGGFDAPKKMGYMVAAYKNADAIGNKVSWKELEGKSIDDLKDLCYTDKDLTYADTQVQFYKQNAAAASLIGVFAVNKVAHATLESNNIWLDVSEICGDDAFTIAGTTFGKRMQIDKKYDSEGNLIGKTLGSLVSASADAVKDPILNLMNINMTTAGILNTMLRLGMPFNDAALFLSQDIIGRVLNQFNKENLNNFKSLDAIIEEWLSAYRNKHSITDESKINTEALTKEELVEGLTGNEHETTDYKVLLAFQKMRALTDAMRKPTYITRFNSISSAVGPLIIDNLIMEHKLDAFNENAPKEGTHFYNAETKGEMVNMYSIFADHPLLKQFYRTVGMAKTLFHDMPTGSTGFRNLMHHFAAKYPDIANRLYSDKKLFDQFANFYQSYLLIASGVINTENLSNYVNGFAKWFMKQKYDEKYPSNELIKAIKMNVTKASKRPFLTINTTGADEQAKEVLRSGWIDIHKADPALSQRLFEYSFFRAGIGFSPKTFMSLVPTYVKERIKSKSGNSSYVDTYRNFPDVSMHFDMIIDQFIRNNWDNNKLAPYAGNKKSSFNIDVPHNRLSVWKEEDKALVRNLSYIKTRGKGGVTYLWEKQGIFEGSKDIVFKLVKPLGNNGEYLEMSLEEIKTPLSNTTKTTEDNTASPFEETVPTQDSNEETPTSPITNREATRQVSELAKLMMMQVPSWTVEDAERNIESIKANPWKSRKFLQNVFKHKGLDLNEQEAIEEFKKMC